MTMTFDLLNCPFCGSSNVDVDFMGPPFRSHCDDCNASGPLTGTMPAAAEAWNTRHFGSPYRQEASNEIGALPEEAPYEAGQAVIDNEAASIKRASENPGGN